MLAYLRIQGLALLDDVALELAPGLNVLTGETGAGKSIIVDALTLLRGARGRAELVRHGADAARVDASFDLPDAGHRAMAERLAEHGVELGDGEGIVLARVLPATGRGRSFVQGVLLSQSVLAAVGELLIDVCSQHEHHSLTHTVKHGDLLDAYAGLERDVQVYGALFERWRAATAELASLRARAREADARSDYLRFQIDELERVDPVPGEYEQLRAKSRLLREAHEWAAFARLALEQLYEGDEAIAGRLSALAERARRGAEESTWLAAIDEQLAAAQAACEDAARAAARFGEELDADPEQLEAMEARLHALEALRRKHGGELDELAARLDAMREELQALLDVDEHVARAAATAAAYEAELRGRAEALLTARTAAAATLGGAIEAELKGLHMAGARVEAVVERDPSGELGPRGLDRVELRFSANKGEALAPLRRVASGGELSRVLLAVLLAIQGVADTGDRVATFVFDEVDAGVGGAVADAIGRRLRAASRRHQVLCITHLPQIAAYADAHFRVEKRELHGRTVTRVDRLDDAARVAELARMLAGADVGASALEHAAALRAHAIAGPAPSDAAVGAPSTGRASPRRAAPSSAPRGGRAGKRPPA